MATIAERIVNSIKYLADHGIDSSTVSDEVFEQRISICEACPNFRASTRQCKICNCFMDVKARLINDPVRSVASGQTLKTKCAAEPPLWT